MDKICIVGFGRIGSVIGSYLAENKNNIVYGIDQNKNLINNFKHNINIFKEPGLQLKIKRALKNKKLYLTNNFNIISKCKYIIICVGTPLIKNSQKIDTSYLKNSFNKIKKYLNKNKVVILKSSVTPGTTQTIFQKQINKIKFKFAYCPERLAEGSAFDDIKKNKVIVGSYDKNSLNKICNFWERNFIKIIKLSNPEEAEITKLACNAWIDVNIGLANEIAKIVDNINLNIDVMNVIKAANTLKKGSSNVNILYPSIGVGGYCLTKDPLFLNSLKSKDEKFSIIKKARNVNENMPKYCANRIINFLQKNKIQRSNSNFLILGATYKGNTDDVRETPILEFINELKKNKISNIVIFDKNIQKEDRGYFNCKFSDDLKNSLKKSNVLVIGADHKYIINNTNSLIYKNFNRNGLIFDGRRFFSNYEKKNIKKNKIKFLGIGRS